jgi:ABC-2 type transport system ATP-binding protein
MTETPAIAVDQLWKIYREGLFGRRKFEALRGVSFEVSRGEIFGLLGPNGAGKTTIIKVLLGIIRKSRGEAYLLGHLAGRRAGRIRVGYLPEHLRIPTHHNAYSALDYYGRLSGLSSGEVKARRGELLAEVGLPADRHRDRVKKYSKGMLQRLGLAQALLHDPDLLILDEPTDGLDPVGRREVRDLLGRLRQRGKTIFLNSHLLQEVEMVCDRVAILNRGELRGIGRPDDLGRQAHPGLQVRLAVSGSNEAIGQALQGREATTRPAGSDQVEIELRLPDQTAVDALVDDLRRCEVSIVGLIRHRATLEDTFLALLARDEDQPVEALPVEEP